VLALLEKLSILLQHTYNIMSHTLTASARTGKGSRIAKTLRAEGKLPAVVYGPGHEPQSITLLTKEFEKAWRAAGESTVVSLTGIGAEVSVLIQDVTVDPIFGTPTHADLLAVRNDQPVTVTVPLTFTGTAPAEKLGGTLIKVLHELEIEALPKDLPHDITVDVTSLNTFDDQIHVSDITLPTGVTAVTHLEEVIALVQAASEEEEATGPVDLTAIAVVKKGKEEVAE
jgi:large subunit ribosomal protein L25